MSENFLIKLLEHNNWANLQILQVCSTLSDEQLDAQPRSVTKGNIRSTLIHLVASQRGYLSLLTQASDAAPQTLLGFAELQASVMASGEGLLASARMENSHQCSFVVSMTNGLAEKIDCTTRIAFSAGSESHVRESRLLATQTLMK